MCIGGLNLQVVGDRIALLMPKSRHRGGGPASLIRTKAGNLVKSRSEAQIDNWLYKRGFDFEYEPKLWLEGEGLSPDWIVSGLKGRKFDRPLIIEYWGLLRPGKAAWLPKRIPKYLERKAHKESIYERSDYNFMGIMPQDLFSLTETLEDCLFRLAYKWQTNDLTEHHT